MNHATSDPFSIGALELMSATSKPEPSDQKQVADAVPGNWVDEWAPPSWRPYLRLARADRPIGVWLLLWPCWWSLALAGLHLGAAYPDPWYMVLFAVGALAMRAAGCTWNDIIDRDIDAKVARTRSRPIASGQVSVLAAMMFMGTLCLIGFAVLLQFNLFTVILGMASLGIVASYPFMKRFTYWPQVVLGLAFSWGALMRWASVQADLGLAAMLLYAGAVCWPVGYDTIYAHQDKEDAALLGLKSTALKFGDKTKPWLTLFYSLAFAGIVLAGLMAGAGLAFTLIMAAAGAHFIWQVVTLDVSDERNCLVRFRSNRDAGAIIFAAILVDMVLNSLG